MSADRFLQDFAPDRFDQVFAATVSLRAPLLDRIEMIADVVTLHILMEDST